MLTLFPLVHIDDDYFLVFGSTYHGGLIARGGTALRESLSSPSDLTGRIPWRKRSTREIHDPNAGRTGIVLYMSHLGGLTSGLKKSSLLMRLLRKHYQVPNVIVLVQY